MPEKMVVCASHSPLMEHSDGGAEGTLFRESLDTVRAQIEQFDPTVVVMFGPDHRRAFPSVVPPFAIVASATGIGDWGTPQQPYDVPSGVAAGLLEYLLGRDLDVAFAKDVRLDHGFSQTCWQLLGALDARPVLPIFVNCAVPPLPSIRRVIALGREVGRYFDDQLVDARVLFLASGGLSHNPPAPAGRAVPLSEAEKVQYILDRIDDAGAEIQPDWDAAFLAALGAADWQFLQDLSFADIAVAGTGAHEIRTWVAAAAAGGGPVQTF